jgi:hypothetical protein
VTFSSISQAYRDLVIVIQANTSPADYAIIRFNSDTGSNYNFVGMYGDGVARQSAAYPNGTFGYIDAWGAYSTTIKSSDVINIFDYSTTDKHKSFLVRRDQPDNGTQASAQRWASTAAITTILVKPSTANWSAGSTFALYGVSA